MKFFAALIPFVAIVAQADPYDSAAARALCVNDAPATSLQGTWQTNVNEGPLTLHMQFGFSGSMMTLTNICEMGGHSSSAHVTVPFQSAGSSFTAVGVGHDDENQNGIDCNVDIQQDQTVSYAFDGGCLVLENPTGPSLYLKSVR